MRKVFRFAEGRYREIYRARNTGAGENSREGKGVTALFDWFREVGEELCGIDSESARKQRMEKKEQKKVDCFIFSRGTKIAVILLGLLYVVMAGSTILALKGLPGVGLIILKYVLMSVLAIAVVFALLFGKKKGEIVALAGAFVFVVVLFLSTVLR